MSLTNNIIEFENVKPKTEKLLNFRKENVVFVDVKNHKFLPSECLKVPF